MLPHADGKFLNCFRYFLHFLFCNQDKSFKGAELLVAFGGPNIYINTVTKTVEGSWGGSSQVASYQDSIGLEDYCEELFHC